MRSAPTGLNRRVLAPRRIPLNSQPSTLNCPPHGIATCFAALFVLPVLLVATAMKLTVLPAAFAMVTVWPTRFSTASWTKSVSTVSIFHLSLKLVA